MGLLAFFLLLLWSGVSFYPDWLWFFPFVFMALAAIVICLLIRRWSTRVLAETVPRFEEAQLAEYKERLEKELKEFDEGF